MRDTLTLNVALFVAFLAYMVSVEAQVTPAPHVEPKYDIATSTNAFLFADTDKYETAATSTITYFENTRGFLARPEQPGIYPGIILVHDKWGLNEHMKNTARVLSAEGYMVLAVDLYGGEVAENEREATRLQSKVEPQLRLANMKAAAAHLRAVGAPTVAALGWCFGGTETLRLAMSGETLSAAIMFYGEPEVNRARLSAIKPPVLGIFAKNDAVIGSANVRAFNNSLDAAGVEKRIHIFPDVEHSFADPSSSIETPRQTREAWNLTLAFLSTHTR